MSDIGRSCVHCWHNIYPEHGKYAPEVYPNVVTKSNQRVCCHCGEVRE